MPSVLTIVRIALPLLQRVYRVLFSHDRPYLINDLAFHAYLCTFDFGYINPLIESVPTSFEEDDHRFFQRGAFPGFRPSPE